MRSLGYDVTYVRNITDIDDKIIRRAAENDEPIDALTGRFIQRDGRGLRGARHAEAGPSSRVRPSHLRDIISMIEQLVEQGYAYVADDGDVLYSVSSFPGYGKLSGKRSRICAQARASKSTQAKQRSARLRAVEVGKAGRAAVGFAAGAADGPAGTSSAQPCRTQVLGDATSTSMAAGWTCSSRTTRTRSRSHARRSTRTFVEPTGCTTASCSVDDEKMSKSLDNFFTIRDVVKVHHPEAVRYFLLATHYRAPINYSEENLLQAKAALDRLYTALRGVEPSTAAATGQALERFRAAMSDDFNTPEAFAVLQSIASDLNKAKADGRASDAMDVGRRIAAARWRSRDAAQ